MKRNVEGRHLGLSKFSFCMANDKLTVGKWSSISFNIIRGNRLNECGFLRKSWKVNLYFVGVEIKRKYLNRNFNVTVKYIWTRLWKRKSC